MTSEASPSTRGIVAVIEDSVHTRNIFTLIFKHNGYEVRSYKDGVQALESLRDEPVPNLKLVFTDIMMPRLNGTELVAQLRMMDHYKEVPVIMVTAVANRDFVTRAKSLGVKAYVLKPVSAQKITECIRKVFPGEEFVDIKVEE